MALEGSPVTQFPSAIERLFTLITREQFDALKSLVDAIELGTIKGGFDSLCNGHNARIFRSKIASSIPILQALGIDLDGIDFSERKCSNFAKLKVLSTTIPQLIQALELGIVFTTKPLPEDEGLGHEVGSTFPKLDLSGLKENAGRKRQKEDIAVFSHEDASKLDENFGAPNSISLEDISASDLLQLGGGDSYYWHGGALKEIAEVLGIHIPPEGNAFFFDRNNKKKIERIVRGVRHLTKCEELTIPLAIDRGQGLYNNTYTIDYISFSEEKGLIIDKIEKFSEDSLGKLMFTRIIINGS